MRGRSVLIGVAGVIVGAGLAGGAVAIAQDDESSVTGATAEKAIAAATEAVGGGTANSVERDPEDGATWEVEVAKPDGSTVDVRLDAAYKVVTTEPDSEGPDNEAETETETEDPTDAADDAAEAAGHDQEGPDDPEQDAGEPPDDSDED